MRRTPRPPALCALLVFAALVIAPCVARAEPVPESLEPPPYHLTGRRVGMGLLGFLTGFVAHESGHLLANFSLGNVPHFRGIMVWGAIPFFAIEPRIPCSGDTCSKHDGTPFRPGRRGKFFIVTSGFHAQHIANEVILSLSPELHGEVAPFRKGWLLFNVFLSCMYAAGAWTGLEAPNGDLGGAAEMADFNPVALSMGLLAPTIVDVYRYFVPQSAHYSAWVARAAKTTFLGLTFTF